MLKLRRKAGESILVICSAGVLEIQVFEAGGKKTLLGFLGPKTIRVIRKEIAHAKGIVPRKGFLMDLNAILDLLPFSGAKTIVAGIGMIAFGVYQVTQGQVATGLPLILQGVAAVGVRHAISKASPPAMKAPPAPPA